VIRAISRIEDGALATDSIEQLANELEVTSRHLRRVFESELGVTPVQFVQTQRLLLAKRLLTDTNMPVSQVAMVSGFASIRRFNALFVERYRMSPSQLRKSTLYQSTKSDTFVCHLSFRPPYDWQSMLNFLRARACPGVEYVDQDKYMRTVSIDGVTGWLSVSLSDKPSTLIVILSASLAPKFLQVLTRLKRLFDLQAKPELIDERLGELAMKHPGLRVPGACDSFEVAIRAILGQLVSVRVASNFAGKVAEKYGKRIDTPFPELSLTTPQAVDLAQARASDLVALGIMPLRAQTVINFAREYLQGKLVLHPGVDYETTVAKLISLPGIGQWTAEYIAMRCLAYPDAFPAGDLGIKKALNLNSQKALKKAVEKYRPWRAYAAMHLWKTLETKIPG
jgi:AraC family transcriptional regulator of adaptative response / DNA-3-methyladenine glycosylase II